MESAGVRYLRTSCWRIRNRTSERSERVKFLIQKQRVRKYRTKHFPCGIVSIIYILRHSSFWRPFYFKSFKNAKKFAATTKSTTKAYVSFCLPLSAVISPALYRFLYRQWNKRNYCTPFPKCFSLFSEKNSLSKTFLVECVRSRAASCNERREFWRQTRTALWLLIGRFIFLTREKTSFAILIGRIIFFTSENHRSLLWLARTNLRTKIYDIAFWWLFLSMYIINVYHLEPAAQFIWLIIVALLFGFKALCLAFCALLVRAQVYDGLFFTIVDV